MGCMRLARGDGADIPDGGPMSDSPARVVDGLYEIVGPLGEGGMGAVFRAVRLADGVTVAVKRLHLEHAADAEARARFEREARALNGLDHPHIIGMLDFGFDAEGPYLVMELLEGATLDVLLERRTLAPEQALDLAIQTAAGLAYAHSNAVVHRDIKPENIFVARGEDGVLTAKLLDFGLARFFDNERWAQAESLTRDGAVLGTPLYMPADQSLGQPADTRSDVYSLGAVIYQALSFSPPFDGDNSMVLIRAHLTQPLRPLAEARQDMEVLPELDELLRSAMAKDAAQRWDHAGALLQALQTLPRPATRLR